MLRVKPRVLRAPRLRKQACLAQPDLGQLHAIPPARPRPPRVTAAPAPCGPTVSIGVASYPEHGDAPEMLLRLADQALYRATHLGRNTIASANDLESMANPPVSVAHP